MSPRRALITGLTGQDGSFLAELLLEKGYVVTGTIRKPSGEPLGAAEHLRGRVELVYADLLDPDSLTAAVGVAGADEIYHLAAPSFVPDSWENTGRTLAEVAGATATLLDAARRHAAHARVFIAGSGAMFGRASDTPQREDTYCRPDTPYATAKLAAHQLVGQFRRHHGLFACSGILYNHESERRPESFVPRKIARGAAAIKLGLTDELVLGDLGAIRDWSFAGDVMRGAWLMLQRDRADDYVLASGVGHTVAELAEAAFAHLDLDAWAYIRVDQELVREPEGAPRVGDPARARTQLGWEPELSFGQLVARMVDADVDGLQRGSRLAGPLPWRR